MGRRRTLSGGYGLKDQYCDLGFGFESDFLGLGLGVESYRLRCIV